jgi:hypothetical protein
VHAGLVLKTLAVMTLVLCGFLAGNRTAIVAAAGAAALLVTRRVHPRRVYTATDYPRPSWLTLAMSGTFAGNMVGRPPAILTPMRVAVVLLLSSALFAGTVTAQQRRTTPPPAAKRSVPPPAPPVVEKPETTCPAPLGFGVTTTRMFCDVLTGRDPAGGIIISFPPHKGPVILRFDLHNRQTYSEEQMKDKRAAFAHYTAVIGALTTDNTLLSRAVIDSEFRSAKDLVDRISGGAGPSGVKAVAPTGSEPITITIPEEESQVSLLGEKLTVERADGTATYASEGRPIAIVSNVTIEYHPAPPKPQPKAPAAAKSPARAVPNSPGH